MHTLNQTSKRTKIIATISDFRCEKDFIKKIYNEGVNAIRFNSAHITTEKASEMMSAVRSVTCEIPCIIDTKGFEIRLTKFDTEFNIAKGDVFEFKGNEDGLSSKECIYVNYENFVADIEVGNRILIDDGELNFKVVRKTSGSLFCEARNPGVFKAKKSVNVPGVHIKLPSLSKKDRDFITWAIKQDIDFIAHSFVRNRDDVLAIQNILDTYNSKIKIIAKIENQLDVENIDEILDCAYGIMIARGDLGIEIEAEKIPQIQRQIINKCRKRKKPVIVATQMLHTMIEHPRATKTEVSDVANAIYSGTDCLMLSGETAYGDYPMEAVKTMTKIAKEVEQYQNFDP